MILALAASPARAEPPTDVPSEGAPSLARVVALARERAPSVAVARAEVAVARSSYAGARLSPLNNPYLEIIAQRGANGATKDVSFQTNLFVPVEISNQRGKRIAEADALVAYQEASVSATQATALGEAVRAYGTAAVAAARAKVFEGVVAVWRTEVQAYEARLAAGDVTAQDEKLAKLELAKNVVALAEIQADQARALAELNRATGARFTAPPADVEPPAPSPNAPQPAAVAARAPAVRALEQESIFHARSRDRQSREAHSPFNVIVTVGRGDLGELRLGGGMSWTLPFFRLNQGDSAKADAERLRAGVERDAQARAVATMLEGLAAEREHVRRAIHTLATMAEPAAQAAVDAAVTTQRAGKSDLLHVLTARRDYALLRARRLDLLQREWNIVSDIVALTGDLP